MTYTFPPSTKENNVTLIGRIKQLERKYQSFLDKLHGKTLQRWIFTSILACIFLFRVLFFQGWYIVTYTLGIYVLNLFILYLSPMIDPEEEQQVRSSADDSGMFKVFIRRLPEFLFWYYFTRALIVAVILTFSRIFDIPVYWPILLIYFIILFIFTMRKQILHMYQHNYLPWTQNKPSYLP